MRHIPVLGSGAAVQFPFSKMRRHRTIRNEMPGGEWIKLIQKGAVRTRWELQYSGLTLAECEALRSFFIQQEGAFQSFVFVDPAANLLRYSEDFLADVWEKDPQIEVTQAGAGPTGTGVANRLRNLGAAEQRIQQATGCPAGLPYCYSTYLRSSSGGEIALLVKVGADEVVTPVVVGSEWRRYVALHEPREGEEGVCFGLALGAGGEVEVAGTQVECQWAPSGYRKTLAESGVYAQARLDSDELAVTAEDVDSYTVTLWVAANG